GLPGNPVSTLVCALLFLKPAIERLLSLEAAEAPPVRARLTVGLPANDQRQDYLRATLKRAADGTLEARPFSRQDSSMMSALAHSDCLIVRQPPRRKFSPQLWLVAFGELNKNIHRVLVFFQSPPGSALRRRPMLTRKQY